MTPHEHLICGLIRGDAPPWPGDGHADECSRFMEGVEFHGVAPLLDRAFACGDAFETWPSAIKDRCREAARMQAVCEMAGRAELARVLGAVAESGVRPLLMKGTPLAYSHYDNPTLRPRSDTDVLIPVSARHAVGTVLDRAGYRRQSGIPGEFVSYQALWSRTDSLGISHDLDVHWRVNNSQTLAGLLDYDELAARAVELPGLCPGAHALAPVHALLMACLHRAGHPNAPHWINGVPYRAGNLLIWLYDVHLLTSRMSDAELRDFASLAERKRMKAICHDALALTAKCFRTSIPESVMEDLLPTGPDEPSARFCRGTPAAQLFENLVALGSMGDRAHWLLEMAFPPAGYMREKYPGATASWLPILYARRAVGGLWKIAVSGNSRGSH